MPIVHFIATLPTMRASWASFLILLLSCVPHTVLGWTTLPSVTRNHASLTRRPISLQSLADPTSSVTLAQESWRQYVPLAVSVFVIGDILLGSPVVNLILAPMQRQIDEDNCEQTAGGATPMKNPKERVDSEKVAQAALDKARNALELRDYLDKKKTDWDRMEEMRKKMDQQVVELDQNLAELEQPKKAD